jgi:ABC-2 type transport system ATP-binding protein
MGPEPILIVEGLQRTFAGRDVIGGLDLRLDPGDRTVLWGPNGSGKSTVLRCVAGSVIPTAGRATLGGHGAGSLGARRLLGTSFSHDRSFYMRISGRSNLVFFARLRGLSRAQAERQVASLEEELELQDIARRRVDSCSTGMMQQLAFARALVGRPALLLLDEPTRSLDEAAAERMWAAIERRPDVALLIATHRRDDLQYCDRRIILPLNGPAT